MRPMLGDLELETVQRLESGEGQALVRHEVPALEGDFLQRLGRRGTRVTLAGVVCGAGAADRLAALRAKVRAAEPVPFLSDVATATRLREVMVERLDAREEAGRPGRFRVSLVLREITEPPPVEEAEEEVPGRGDPEAVEGEVAGEGEAAAEDLVGRIADGVGVLRVRIAPSVPAADLSGLAARVVTTGPDGEEQVFLLTEAVDGVFTKEDLPAGEYRVQAVRV